MLVSDLIKQVADLVDDTDNENDLIMEWFNRCLNDLSPMAKKEGYQSYPITVQNAYTLPSDLLNVAYVMVNQTLHDRLTQDNTVSQGYKMWAGVLSLQNSDTSGNIDLYYYRRLAKLTDLNQEPEIEESFQDLLVLYAVGNLQFREEDYDQRPDKLRDYFVRRTEFARFISGQQAISSIEDVYA